MATPTSNEPRINERIRAREVRLVAPDGQQVGIKPLPEALAMARELDLDLVEVAPMANPPVCRIMDYGKYKYEESQRAKESRRKTASVSIKEMKYRPKIGSGDFGTKTRKVAEFLAEGHKVKVTIMFRGREVYHPELGKEILDRVADRVSSIAKVEVSPRLDGRNMTMVLAPDRRAHPPVPPKPRPAGRPAPAPSGSDAPAAPAATATPNGATGAPPAPAGGAAAPAPPAAAPAGPPDPAGPPAGGAGA